MRIKINGKITILPKKTSLSDLLTLLDISNSRIAVEVNSELITRSKFKETIIEDGSSIEIITAIGGG